MTRRYFGHAGHFVAAAQCRFHIHTHVGAFCISTVGDYHPRNSESDEPEQIGLNRTYETMVFPLGNDDEIDLFEELEMQPYNDRDSANAGHEELVRKYEAQS